MNEEKKYSLMVTSDEYALILFNRDVAERDKTMKNVPYVLLGIPLIILILTSVIGWPAWVVALTGLVCSVPAFYLMYRMGKNSRETVARRMEQAGIVRPEATK